MSSQPPTIAFLGATGGVTNSVLVSALRSGAKVIALVRTPFKLTQQLQAQAISSEVLSSQLTIVTGNALDTTALKATLTANNTPNHIVMHIVSGLGAAPAFGWTWRKPVSFFTIDQPKLCGTAAQALVTALTELYQECPTLAQRKPKLTFVSTTGISNGPEDVPFGMRVLYHNILAVPHMDKRVMEKTFRDSTTGQDGKPVVFSGVVGVRPTLLTGGVNADEGAGIEKLRVGREQKPETGFTVSRADVGKWMWVNVVGDEEKRKGWEMEMVSLTS